MCLRLLRPNVPVDVSRVALAEDLETVLFLNELLSSHGSYLLTGDHASTLQLEPQLCALNETLKLRAVTWTRN